MKLHLWFRTLLATALASLVKISIRTIEIFPVLGILRPLLTSSLTLIRNQEELLDSLPCPNNIRMFQSYQLSSIRIIEVTTYCETGTTRGIGNYLKRLFSEIDHSTLEGVIFISFTKHVASSTNSKFLLGRSIYSIDYQCRNCFDFIEQLSKASNKITLTSYFHENISPKYCSVFLDVIPNSNVIIYDLIPKLNFLNFSSVSKMKVYFVKYQLLARANLYAISRSTEAEIELQGLPVKNVIRYNLVTGETSKAEKDKNILLFGSMTPRKNILRTVMAWDLIQQEFPDYKLVLVGRYSNSAKFLILNVLKSGKDSICFTGEISDLEVDKLFQSAKLLVAPSTAEGLGLPLIKAIEFGTPIICARIDSYLEFVANKKSFFDPFSVSDISQNIWYAVASPDEYITDINLVKIGKVDFSNII